MGLDPHATELLNHEPPTGAPLKGEGDSFPLEAVEPFAKMTSIGGRNPAAGHLASLRIQIVEGDLAPMKIESAYDAHWGPP